MGSISLPQGRGNRQHNMRNYGEGKMPKNINVTMTVENVVWRDETTAHAYHRIFDGAVEEYNEKQKRADRKIKDYRTHILNSKNGEKEFYEDVLQWGKQEDFLEHPELREVAKECLLEYIEGFDERNPGLELVGAYIHMDEASPHMHFDYIPVATGYKTGMQKRNSLDRAMKNLIKIRTGHDYSPRPSERDASGKCTDNATKQWKEMERAHFRMICETHGLIVNEEIQTPERNSLSVMDYKIEKRKEEIERLADREQELKGSILSTRDVMNLDKSLPVLDMECPVENRKVVLTYHQYASLKTTAINADEKLESAEAKLQEADNKMTKAESLMTRAQALMCQATAKMGEAEEKAAEILKAAKEKAAQIVADAQAKFDGLLERINIRLGLIPQKDIYDAREQLKEYYKGCEKYLSSDMKEAIKQEDVSRLKALVSKMVTYNYDGTTRHWERGYEQVSTFVYKFEEYVNMKNQNVSTEEVLKKLHNAEQHSAIHGRYHSRK